jgi:hypothetical protein
MDAWFFQGPSIKCALSWTASLPLSNACFDRTHKAATSRTSHISPSGTPAEAIEGIQTVTSLGESPIRLPLSIQTGAVDGTRRPRGMALP